MKFKQTTIVMMIAPFLIAGCATEEGVDEDGMSFKQFLGGVGAVALMVGAKNGKLQGVDDKAINDAVALSVVMMADGSVDEFNQLSSSNIGDSTYSRSVKAPTSFNSTFTGTQSDNDAIDEAATLPLKNVISKKPQDTTNCTVFDQKGRPNFFYNSCNFDIVVRIRTIGGGCFHNSYGLVGPLKPGKSENFYGWTCGDSRASRVEWVTCGFDDYTKSICDLKFKN